MLQVVQYQKTGEMRVEEVPSPGCRPGGVLVQTAASLISAGTERTSVTNAQASMIERAKAQPEAVKAVLDSVKRDGIMATYEKVTSKLDSFKALGYSASGVVVETRCDEFAVGDRVACAGAGIASHAEFLSVPKNLCVRIPDNVSFDDASYTTLGAIALQGVRQADVRLGETVAVVGLGLLGQLTVQLLKASGVRVIGLDINESLFAMARQFGADACFISSRDSASSIKGFTRGVGTDSVIITASTDSSEPVLLALDVARRKSNVVIVGAVPMNIPRSPFYEKELDLRISCSYGPGRYDPSYEEQGNDYPIAYVRWTENRNMQAFLDLISDGKLVVDIMTTHKIQVQDAAKAYDLITGKVSEPYLGIVLNYPNRPDARVRTVARSTYQKSPKPAVGFIGAGAFAQSMLLPPLKTLGVDFVSVSTGTAVNATSVAQHFAFRNATTDSGSIIEDPNVNFVLCASRHDSHGAYVMKALKAGKPVFVEKPLAISVEEIREITSLVEQTKGRVMVGFNRRFSKSFRSIKDFFSDRSEPMAMIYRVMPGFIPKSSWMHDPMQGGRIIGEGCHFIDCMTFLTGSLPVEVHAMAVSSPNKEWIHRDTVTITIRFADGSIGTVHYLANGDASVPKEYCEVYCEGSTAIMNNFKSVDFHRGKKVKTSNFDGLKGHREEIEQTVKAVVNGTAMPISYAEIEAVSMATMAATESISTGKPILLDSLR